MRGSLRSIACASVVAGVVSTGIGLRAQAVTPTVSLKVSKETAPPGGMAQMKLFITEPKPITTGLAEIDFEAYGSIAGIALVSPANDATGIAVVRGTGMRLSVVSPSGTFGTDPDYPVLTVAGRIPADTPVGVKFPFDLGLGALQLFDPSGVQYAPEFKPGHLVTAWGLSIHDIRPGSAELPAGAVVTILGSGFEPTTKVKFAETLLAEVRHVNAGQIDVVLAQPAHMHGLAVKVTNPDGSRCTYFSYQRTTEFGESQHPVLRDVVPVFPYRFALDAAVDVAGAATGLALQNLESSDASVVAELIAAGGQVVATTVVSVPSNRFVVRELSEIFGIPYAHGDAARIRAPAPIQVMGVAVDPLGHAAPLLAR